MAAIFDRFHTACLSAVRSCFIGIGRCVLSAVPLDRGQTAQFIKCFLYFRTATGDRGLPAVLIVSPYDIPAASW